jgi:predicted methyltransferase MtxX (methanogen marker protein 4)
LRLWENDMPGELLEELGIVRPDMEAAQLELRAGPRGFKGADRNAELRVAFGQSNNRLSLFRHHRHDGKLEASVGIDRDPPAQTENRIEHSASAFR